MLSRCTLAGANALLAAPVVVIVGSLVRLTLTDDASDQFS